jgi:hypothetical protein
MPLESQAAENPYIVIPAKAGIQVLEHQVDPGYCRDDGFRITMVLRSRKIQ